MYFLIWIFPNKLRVQIVSKESLRFMKISEHIYLICFKKLFKNKFL